MEAPYQLIAVEPEGDVTCVRIVPRRLDEVTIHALGNEIIRLIDQDECRQVILSLGPGTLDCLYSVFMAKLVAVQRKLKDRQGRLIICDVTPEVLTVFDACRLRSYFEFTPDRAAALKALGESPHEA
jgi:anti-anti-sigma factor